ncbi:hypothetical protein A2955_03650 [Candidatus Woesebacteria bacterium RIFCSPLOWO2_01_FULL_37_19]|uniref:Uncharacterized protein n=2 Tax=Candidatus Woeseibacteriota TaxID=1752722 RepID=A0A1F8BC40_9BACT|nr:MAG: hypothetical protein A2771_04265 [Candidatus Woesebacteria bacterium RIFCSPHIGHO2_01_FULL_38_26b]OGM60935.1 MAG: hypothetical protein A2955_03650 [Candidatus Woesebacteria bacterium RIFCSPLOWO2_01_FULL_37_19]
MSKRRTRREKEKAREKLAYKWNTELTNLTFEPSVKRQIDKNKKIKYPQNQQLKSAESLVKDENLNLIKRDIIKSLSLAGLLLGIELVLYLALTG